MTSIDKFFKENFCLSAKAHSYNAKPSFLSVSLFKLHPK